MTKLVGLAPLTVPLQSMVKVFAPVLSIPVR